MHRVVILTQVAAAVVLQGSPLSGQGHQHTAGMSHPATATAATAPGQAAFGAIAEVVARLDADPGTDWSTVNLERLRQHLIDMDRVTLDGQVRQSDTPGGFTATVTGPGDVAAAIRRMLTAHAAQMTREGAVTATVVEIPDGVRLTVASTTPNDARAVARLRGLGVIGFLALGGHHGPHHEAMARGTMAH